MKKYFAVFILFIFDMAVFATETAYPISLVISLLGPFISDGLMNILVVISWVLTFLLLVYFAFRLFIGGNADDEYEDLEKKRLKKKLGV